ncbi:MAG TPA: YcxB family protein [Candidatus Methylacidiphilales bacterium]|nr:YcxB family protein [Candidatus Methylacidiphilales bacterium]
MSYAQRQLGRSTIVSVLLMTGGLGFVCYAGYSSSFFQIIGLVLIGCLGFYFWYEYEIKRQWLDTLRRMGNPEAELIVTDESFQVSSGAGSSTIPWNQFVDIWRYDDFWLLFLTKFGRPLTIPLKDVDPNVLRLIEERIAQFKKSTGF